MTEIIGRKHEKAMLDDAMNSPRAEFIAVYGRRRVGKTYLIKNHLQSKPCALFQMTGIYKGKLKTQLARFAKELGVAFYQNAPIKIPLDWMEAFESLTQALSNIPQDKKIVIFLDELPWLAGNKSGMMSALEYFWNRHWVDDTRIKLVVCGSAASWLIKRIIKNKGGLHNRVTRKIRLLPFDLKDTLQYLKHIGVACDLKQTLKIYMVMGGIPFYLNQLKSNYSIDQNIDALFFNPDGALFDEFDEVFASLFNNKEQYKELITLIGSMQSGIRRSVLDKENKLSGKGGRLTKRLEDLEYAGFITSYTPYGHKKFGQYYRLSDEYCYFYLKWMEPIRGMVKQNKTENYWCSQINTPAYHQWLGYAFESVTFKHVSQIRKALNIGDGSFASSWRYSPRVGVLEKGAQIDLLLDRSDDAISICEIKYTDQPFSIDKQYAANLVNKVDVFKKITKTSKQLFLVIISANGLKETMYSAGLISQTISAEDFFL